MLRFAAFAILTFFANFAFGQDGLPGLAGKTIPVLAPRPLFEIKTPIAAPERLDIERFRMGAFGEVGGIPAAAPQPTIQIKEFVVTAQRLSIDNFSLPVPATKLDRNCLRQRNPRSVPEALFGAPGIFLQKTNHGGGSPFIRGLTGQQILMLVDGIRLNNATFRSGPNQYLNTLDPAWIADIEWVQSSGAAAYGSDAIGGVLQVLTHALGTSAKTTFRPEAGVRWMSGGMEFSGESALNAYGKRWAARAGGAYRNFGDLVAGRGRGRESPTGYRQWSAEAKAMFQIKPNIGLTAAYQDLEQRAVPLFHRVKSENFQYYNFDPQRRQLGYARLDADFRNPWIRKIEATASRQRSFEVRESRRNNSPARVVETDEVLTNGFQISALSNISEYWHMTTGLEWYADLVHSGRTDRNENTGISLVKRGLYPEGAAMQSRALYNLHNYSRKRLTLTGGLRYNDFRIRVADEKADRVELRPSALVGNLGASYELLRGVRGFANVATAFRAPNVDDLGTLGIVDFRYEQPNFSLQPEKSRSLEGGLKVDRSTLQAQMSVYRLQLRGLIGRVRTADSLEGFAVYRKENIAEAYIRGMDAQLRWRRLGSPWTGRANLCYTYGENTSAREPLRRIPPLHGRVSIEYSVKKDFNLRAETLFAGAQRRLSKADIDDNRIADDGTPGWQIVNFGAFYGYRHFDLSVEFHNIFDEAYRTHGSGVDGVGRCVWARVGFRL
jgi:hemoglobin/transferrin/lactoferrin receptor protein